LGFEGVYEGGEGFLVFGSVFHFDVGHGFTWFILWLVGLIWALSGRGVGGPPPVCWGCVFGGVFGVFLLFGGFFCVLLVLFWY